jgi:hypothetical protein
MVSCFQIARWLGHVLLAVAVGSTVAVGSREIFFQIAPWLGHVLLAVAVSSLVFFVLKNSPLVGAWVAGHRCGLESACGLGCRYFNIATWSEHVLLVVAVGSTVAVGSQEVIFKIAPWFEHVLLAVAVGSPVAVGSREVVFKIAPWFGPCVAGYGGRGLAGSDY